MIFAPLDTDAPIYYWPRATLALIAVNVAVFLVVVSGGAGRFEEVVGACGLTHGGGLHPLQWLTSNFLHRDVLHLAGNMIFLWGFGLVVEGKTGWRVFAALYLGLCVAECAIEQTLFRGAAGASFGASAAVFGLMAVALVWAPRNDLVIGYWLPVYGVGSWDVSIVAFSLGMVGVQSLLAWWMGMTINSHVLHLLGTALGFAAGTVMLRRGLVDCEGWDLFSVMKGTHRRSAAGDMYIPVREHPVEAESAGSASARRRRPANVERGAVRRKAKCIRKVRELLDAGQPREAYDTLRAAQHVLVEWHLPAADHLRLAEALERAGDWSEALALLEDYVSMHPRDADPIRVVAAEVLVRRQNRPHAALRMLEPMAAGALHPKLEARRRAVAGAARELIERGVIEVDQTVLR